MSYAERIHFFQCTLASTCRNPVRILNPGSWVMFDMTSLPPLILNASRILHANVVTMHQTAAVFEMPIVFHTFVHRPGKRHLKRGRACAGAPLQGGARPFSSPTAPQRADPADPASSAPQSIRAIRAIRAIQAAPGADPPTTGSMFARPCSLFLFLCLLSLSPSVSGGTLTLIEHAPVYVRLHTKPPPGHCDRALCVPLAANATCNAVNFAYHRSCRTGRCVLGGLGAPCSDTTGTGCPAKMRCVSGKCTRPGLGQACDTSVQCLDGLNCVPQRDGLGLCGAI